MIIYAQKFKDIQTMINYARGAFGRSLACVNPQKRYGPFDQRMMSFGDSALQFDNNECNSGLSWMLEDALLLAPA
jgi:hypothetical protein